MKFLSGYCALLLVFAVSAFGQGYICAVGGGSEDYNSWSDAPYSWIVQKADSQRIIVLSANAETQWIPTYFMSFGADTAFNYRINTTAIANDSATYRAIVQCRGVFIKGGDQWNYVRYWKNTLTQQAIRAVFLAGGVVAGTSAGAMVLSEVVSDAQYGSADSRTALRNPRTPTLSLTTDFLQLVPGTVIDTHFHERGRFGRLLAMVAKFSVDAGRRITGIGIEDLTALCISPGGTAEVMGSGSVSFYTQAPSSFARVESNRPLIMTNVNVDALVAGYVYDLNSHAVSHVLPTAVVPGPGTSEPPANAITLFGDAFPSPDGITTFVTSAGGAGSACCVVSPPAASAAGQRYVDTLRNRGVNGTSLLLLDSTSMNNAAYASLIAQTRGIVFASNLSEQFPSCVDSSTAVGYALQQRLRSGVAVAYAEQDAKLAGRIVVFRTESDELAAYKGKLVLGKGTGALRNLLVMPLIFQSDTYDENRSTGLMWGLAKNDGKTGVYIDEGGYVTISPSGTFQSSGLTSAVVVDARNARYAGFSTYVASGGIGPRQSAAIVGGTIQVIADDVRYNAISGEVITSVKERAAPGTGLRLESYPNPFNPSTQIRYHLPARDNVRLGIYDMLGREVSVLADGLRQAGTYEATFEPRSLASGIYIARMTSGSLNISRKLLFLK